MVFARRHIFRHATFMGLQNLPSLAPPSSTSANVRQRSWTARNTTNNRNHNHFETSFTARISAADADVKVEPCPWAQTSVIRFKCGLK